MTPASDATRQNRKILAWGLAWGGVLLALFALWLPEKYSDWPRWLSIVLWILAGITLALSGWQGYLAWRKSGEPQAPDLLDKHQKLVGGMLAAVSPVFLALGIWLGYRERLTGLGEAVGLILFGFIVLATGVRLLRTGLQAAPTESAPAQPLGERILLWLLPRRGQMQMILLVGGMALVVWGLWLRFKLEVPLPRWGGAGLLGLVFLATGIWLMFRREFDMSQARMLVLLVGGLSGLVIALMTLIQAWQWRQDVFLRGLSGWRGPDAWRLWLCAYLELVGLGLMFASLLLARADIRFNPILRRILYGYNAILTGFLVLVILVVLNIVVYAALPMTFEFSESRGLYSISDYTIDILQKLDRPTKVYVLLSPRSPVYKDIHTLLDNCQVITTKLEVDYVSPDRDLIQYEELAKDYPEILPTDLRREESGRGVLIKYGVEKKAPFVFISSDKMIEQKGFHTRRPTIAFKGEDVLISNLLSLMTGKKEMKIYVLQGNGEMDMHGSILPRRPNPTVDMNQVGIQEFVDRLKKDGYQIRGLSFAEGKDDPLVERVAKDKDGQKNVPKDASVLIIPAPSYKIPSETLEALRRYMNNKGRLIVFLDILLKDDYSEMRTTGLEDFLKEYNVQVTNDYAVRIPPIIEEGGKKLMVRDDPLLAMCAVPEKTKHPLATKFVQLPFPFRTARVIRPGSGPGQFKAEPLLQAISTRQRGLAFSESKLNLLKGDIFKYVFDMVNNREEPRDLDPIPVAVGVTEGEDKPRMVVFGDGEFISDLSFIIERRYLDNYVNFIASSLSWLSERPGIGIKPREAGIYTFRKEMETGRMVFLPGGIMCLFVFGFATGIWVVRRK